MLTWGDQERPSVPGWVGDRGRIAKRLNNLNGTGFTSESWNCHPLLLSR
jgi:hypothetical protein